MAIGVADYGANALLNALFNGVSLPSLVVALLVGDADQGFDGTILANVEVSTISTGYARQSAPTWTTPDGGFLTSATTVNFGTAAADWGLVSGWALLDATTGGNLYIYGEFANQSYVAAGSTFAVPAGGLTITLKGPESGIVV